MPAEKKFLPSFHVFLSEDLTKEAFVHWTDALGERHRKKGGINRFHTYEERLAAAQALVAKLEKEFVQPSPIGERMRAWITNRQGKWKKKSFRTFKSKVEVFLDWVKGRPIDAALVTDFFLHLSRTAHGKTRNAYHYTLKRIFKDLDMPGLMAGIEKSVAISTPAKYFQTHQIARLKAYLQEHDPELWLACLFQYFCFIRPGNELHGLKISDIHFDEWKICVRSSISKNKYQQFVTIPKAFRPAIEGLKRRSPNEFVFFTEDCTKRAGTDYLSKRFRKVLTELGFGIEYKFYSWKHTGAVAAVKAGASLKELQLQLRHHSLDEVDKYLRQLGVWDLNRLEELFPAPGEEVVRMDGAVAEVVGRIVKMHPGRPIVEVLEELLKAA